MNKVPIARRIVFYIAITHMGFMTILVMADVLGAFQAGLSDSVPRSIIWQIMFAWAMIFSMIAFVSLIYNSVIAQSLDDRRTYLSGLPEVRQQIADVRRESVTTVQTVQKRDVARISN